MGPFRHLFCHGDEWQKDEKGLLEPSHPSIAKTRNCAFLLLFAKLATSQWRCLRPSQLQAPWSETENWIGVFLL
jgi:hypothetical protein